jgi:hypothetical protein
MTFAKGTAAASLGLTREAGAYLSTPGQITTSLSAWLNNIVQQDSQWSSFQMTYPIAPSTAEALSDWSAASDGRFKYLKGYTTSTPPIDPPSSTAEIVDPAGSNSLAGASAPTLAQPGYHVPTAGASRDTRDDPGYYTPYASATAETIDGHPADRVGSAGVTNVTRIAPGGWEQLVDQDFAGAGAARSCFDDNIASGLLLLSPGAAATALNIGVTVPTAKAGSGLYGDFILGGVTQADGGHLQHGHSHYVYI